jgi:hypothetical protein
LDFILVAKKYSVWRFAPNPVLVLDKFPYGERFFSLYGKNLSPCGKFNDINAKQKQKSAILPMRELAKDKLLEVGGFTALREIFIVRGEKYTVEYIF